MFDLIVAYFAICGLGILLSLALPPARQADVLGWLGGLAALAAVAAGAAALLAGHGFTQTLWSVPGVAMLTLRLDPLSALFVLVTLLLPKGLLGTFQAWWDGRKERQLAADTASAVAEDGVIEPHMAE